MGHAIELFSGLSSYVLYYHTTTIVQSGGSFRASTARGCAQKKEQFDPWSIGGLSPPMLPHVQYDNYWEN